MNIFSFTAEFDSEDSCRSHFKEERDKLGVVCKRCSHTEHYWIKSQWSYACKKCRSRTSLRSGTIRKDEQEVEIKKDYADSVDKEASWLKKRGKYRYGYKKHHVTDPEGLVLGVLTTKASTNEVSNLAEVLDIADLQRISL